MFVLLPRDDNKSNNRVPVLRRNLKDKGTMGQEEFKPWLEVRTTKRSELGNQIKSIKNSIELHRSREERILRLSSCGQQCQEISENEDEKSHWIWQ